jgi:hypothetical protein
MSSLCSQECVLVARLTLPRRMARCRLTPTAPTTRTQTYTRSSVYAFPGTGVALGGRSGTSRLLTDPEEGGGAATGSVAPVVPSNIRTHGDVGPGEEGWLWAMGRPVL